MCGARFWSLEIDLALATKRIYHIHFNMNLNIIMHDEEHIFLHVKMYTECCQFYLLTLSKLPLKYLHRSLTFFCMEQPQINNIVPCHERPRVPLQNNQFCCTSITKCIRQICVLCVFLCKLSRRIKMTSKVPGSEPVWLHLSQIFDLHFIKNLGWRSIVRSPATVYLGSNFSSLPCKFPPINYSWMQHGALSHWKASTL